MRRISGRIAMAAGLAMTTELHAQRVVVDLSTTHQTIRGFGGMNHPVWTGYDLGPTDRDLAFGTGPGQMGLTALRIWVSPNESQWSREVPTARDVIARGGIVFASAWTQPSSISQPYTFTRWGSTVNSFKVPASNYAAYVEHLNRFSQFMRSQGVPLHAISFQNEPDWADGWTHWTVDEVVDFTRNHAARLRVDGVRVITAESFNYNKSFYDRLLRDPQALAGFDILGAHTYGSNPSTPSSFFQYPLADQLAPLKERWMTEHYTESQGNANLWRGVIVTGDQNENPQIDTVRALDVAFDVHRTLVEGGFSLYAWWYIRRNYSLIMNDTQNNVRPSGATADQVGAITKRGWCLAQFARHVRPGAVRVEATPNPAPLVYASAFRKVDSVVVVLINRDRNRRPVIEVSVPGATDIMSWRRIVTSATKNLQDDGLVQASGGVFAVTLDEESVTTLVGVRISSPSETREPFSRVQTIPGTVEVEQFDRGGEGVAYHDRDSENRGVAWRLGGVDIVGDSVTWFGVGYIQTGEWLEYTVDIAQGGIHTMQARVASGGEGGSFRLLAGGTAITDSVAVPSTGSFSEWTTVRAVTASLPAGRQILRLEVLGSWFNIDRIVFEQGEPSSMHTGRTKPGDGTPDMEVFDLRGQRIGVVLGGDPHPVRERVADLVARPGLYVVRPVDGGAANLISVVDWP